jgi:hypothetical protein
MNSEVIFDKVFRAVQCSSKRILFSTFCTGTVGSSPQSELGSIHQYIILYTKMSSNCITDLNTQSETIKYLGENLPDFVFGETFFHTAQKSKFIIEQILNWTSSKFKTLLHKI